MLRSRRGRQDAYVLFVSPVPVEEDAAGVLDSFFAAVSPVLVSLFPLPDEAGEDPDFP